MRRFHHRLATGTASPATPQRVCSDSSATPFVRRLQRGLLVVLTVIALISAFTVTPGVTDAASRAKAASSQQALSSSSYPLANYQAYGSNDLTPHQGSVITNPTAYLIFEGSWAASDMQTVKQYFIDVSGSSLEGILTQYSGISDTITVSGSVVDTNFLYGTNCSTPYFGSNTVEDDGWADSSNQVYDEITNKINDNHWSTTNAIFFLFPPPNFEVADPFQSCATPACGYHNNIGAVIYAVIPWGGGGCTNDSTFPSNATALDKTINTTSHEQFEAITDPTWTWILPSGNDGWYSSDTCNGNPCEIGDKCSNPNIGTATHPGVFLNGHFYNAVQGEYSNLTGNCEYPAPPDVVDVVGGGAFYTVWQSVGGATGALGVSIDTWYSIIGGQQQDFQYGSIYWSSSTGTYEVQGSIYNEYANVWHGPTGGLGFPTSNELGIANGRVSYFYGNLCGSRGPNNSGSAIYYTSGTGAHQVGGCIYNKYWNMNGPNSQLGFPTSDVQAISGGYVSYFYGVRCGGNASGPYNSGSAIYYNGAGHYVQGCIYAAYQRLGATTSAQSYPVSDEVKLYNSGGTLVGWTSYFAGVHCGGSYNGPYNSGSAIYVPSYNNSTGGGHQVQGCIYAAYQRLGGPNSVLGFPVSDETKLYNSSGTLVGWASYFAGAQCGTSNPYGSGSAIYVPASNNSSSGGFEVQGCIYTTYQNWGGPTGALGFPISDEYTIDSAGDRESDFQGGYITWIKATGLVTVHSYIGCGAATSC